MIWRTPAMCAICPFQRRGGGLALRKSLAPGRWREILHALRNDRHFHCHMTTDETGNGTNLVCAGSIEWSDKHGVSQNIVRVMQRIDWFRSKERENVRDKNNRGRKRT